MASIKKLNKDTKNKKAFTLKTFVINPTNMLFLGFDLELLLVFSDLEINIFIPKYMI